MVVRPSGGFHGTIGGGAMEWRALAEAREALAKGGAPRGAASSRSGPISPNAAADGWNGESRCSIARDLPELEPRARRGRRIRRRGAAVCPVRRRPCRARARARAGAAAVRGDLDRFARRRVPRPHVPPISKLICSPDPPAELAAAPDGALVLVMTHSHPLDLAIVAEALRQDRFGYVGLIGSATKRARFESQMRAAGLPSRSLAQARLPDRHSRHSRQGAGGDCGFRCGAIAA